MADLALVSGISNWSGLMSAAASLRPSPSMKLKESTWGFPAIQAPWLQTTVCDRLLFYMTDRPEFHWPHRLKEIETKHSILVVYGPMMYQIHYEGKWEGVGPWTSRLLWHRAFRQVPFGLKKSRDFQGPTPSHLPKQWICPHQKHDVQGCINLRSIGSFRYMRFHCPAQQILLTKLPPPPSRSLYSPQQWPVQ